MSMRLGDKIRALRKAKDLTLDKLAELTDSSKGYIWELENRDNKNPSAEKIIKIAEVLGVTAEFLLDNRIAKPDEGVLKNAFFKKFERLTADDQKRFMKIIEDWGEEK